MNIRDEQLKSIRPTIKFEEAEQPLDGFQGVLRQILKFQNDALVSCSIHYLNHTFKNFQSFDEIRKKELFLKSLKSDLGFKKEILGMIRGLFTADELEFYFTAQKEIDKRLIEFIFNRVVSQIM